VWSLCVSREEEQEEGGRRKRNWKIDMRNPLSSIITKEHSSLVAAADAGFRKAKLGEQSFYNLLKWLHNLEH